MNARLDSALEVWGNFTETMTGTRTVPGRLSYDPLKGINLELAGAPTDGGLQALLEMPSLPTLYGLLVDGTRVTLVDCFIKKKQIGAGAVGLPTAVFANRMLVGAHVDDPDQMQIKSYTMELSSLSNWMCASSPAKWDFPKTDGKPIGVDITYRTPDPIDIELPEETFDLQMSHGFEMSMTCGSVAVNWHAGLTISAHDNMALADALKISWQCQNLMSLLIGDQLSEKSIAIKSVDPASASATEAPLRLIYQQRGKHDQSDLHSAEMLLPYSLIKEEFPRIVAEWFARSDQAVLATNVFFGSELYESPVLEVRFLAITQAVESYHRSLGTGVYMKQEEYDSAITEFQSHMPSVIKDDHRQSFKNRLKYGNEYSLRKRLTEMLERIQQDVRSGIVGNLSRFVGKIADTRNYFTHCDHDARANAFQGKDILVASERLRILVVVNLLHDLGIKDETLLSIVSRNRRFQHWMSQDMPL